MITKGWSINDKNDGPDCRELERLLVIKRMRQPFGDEVLVSLGSIRRSNQGASLEHPLASRIPGDWSQGPFVQATLPPTIDESA
jgi:hypothetical protein